MKKEASEEIDVVKQPEIHITWSGNPMEHPTIEFQGLWTHRQIMSLPQEINLAFTKHLTELRSAGFGKTDTNEQE